MIISRLPVVASPFLELNVAFGDLNCPSITGGIVEHARLGRCLWDDQTVRFQGGGSWLALDDIPVSWDI